MLVLRIEQAQIDLVVCVRHERQVLQVMRVQVAQAGIETTVGAGTRYLTSLTSPVTSATKYFLHPAKAFA